MTFKYTFDNKRYHTFNYYLKNTYNQKVAKIALNANFNCPNRDGTKAIGGCIFCNAKGSSDYSSPYVGNLIEQYQEYKEKYIDPKWPNAKTIAYFQAFSNTYGPISKIKNMIQPFLEKKEVVEISLATRADCLNEEIVEFLNSLTKTKVIWLEIGLQSSKDESLKFLNRAETFKEFKEKMKLLENTNIKVCIHLINGIINETKSDMLKTIKDLRNIKIHAVKFHMLEILKDTKLSFLDKINNYKMLNLDEYIDILISQLELLNPEIIVQRICGDASFEELIKPLWVRDKLKIRNELDKKMKELNSWQGKYYEC